MVVAAAARLGFTKARAKPACGPSGNWNEPWAFFAFFGIMWHGGFTGPQMPARKVGDVVTGRVERVVGDEAFIIPKGFPKRTDTVLKCGNLSEETELEPGSVIKGKVVQVCKPEPPQRPQKPPKLRDVCLLEILESIGSQSPWDKLWACFLTTSPVKVTLRKWMHFGWRVTTEEGLVGFIHERYLHGPVYGRFFNNPDLAGKELEVRIFQIKENYREPVQYRDYSIEFRLHYFDLGSEASVAYKYREGDVVAATVQSFIHSRSMYILIDGVRFRLTHRDVLSDVLHIGEVIKVFCGESDLTEVRWLMLEPEHGALQKNKEKVFEEAEATGKWFMQRRAEQKACFEETMRRMQLPPDVLETRDVLETQDEEEDEEENKNPREAPDIDRFWGRAGPSIC